MTNQDTQAKADEIVNAYASMIENNEHSAENRILILRDLIAAALEEVRQVVPNIDVYRKSDELADWIWQNCIEKKTSDVHVMRRRIRKALQDCIPKNALTPQEIRNEALEAAATSVHNVWIDRPQTTGCQSYMDAIRALKTEGK